MKLMMTQDTLSKVEERIHMFATLKNTHAFNLSSELWEVLVTPTSQILLAHIFIIVMILKYISFTVHVCLSFSNPGDPSKESDLGG